LIYDNDAPPEEIWQTGRIEFALRYPFSNGWRTVAGCALLVFFSSVALSFLPLVYGFVSFLSAALPPLAVFAVRISVLVSLTLPALVLVGYGYTVCRETAYGGLRVPELDGLSSLAWKGLFVVVLVSPVLLATAEAGFSVTESVDSQEAEVAIAAVVLSVVSYFGAALVTVYAVTGSAVKTTFSARTLRFAASAHYVKAWLLQFVVVVALVLVGAISVPTVIGAVLWPGYAVIALAAYWGRVYKEAMDNGVVEPEDTSV